MEHGGLIRPPMCPSAPSHSRQPLILMCHKTLVLCSGSWGLQIIFSSSKAFQHLDDLIIQWNNGKES